MSVLDRDAARDWIDRWHRGAELITTNTLLDALEACVRPAPQQTIDREQVMIALSDYEAEVWEVARRDFGKLPSQGEYADRILALLRPVNSEDRLVMSRKEYDAELELAYHEGRDETGVTLTREEAQRALDAVVRGGFRTEVAADQALALRLEAAS